MKKIDPEIEKTIIGAINTLEAFLKTDYTTKELHEHIGLQLHLMTVLNFKNSPALFDYVKEEASFEELYAASGLINDYMKWLFSPWEPEFILKLLEKIMEGDPSDFRKLEVAALTHRAIHMKSASQWWFNTFDAVLHFYVGNSAQFRLSKTASEQASNADRIEYTFRKYPILLSMPFFGFPEPGTQSVDREFFSLHKKAKPFLNIPLPSDAESDRRFDFVDESRLQTHYDNSSEYIVKLLETRWEPKKALRLLCEGNLYKHTFGRAYSRWKDRWGGYSWRDLKQHEGEKYTDSVDFKEHGDETMEQRIDPDLLKAAPFPKNDISPEAEAINQQLREVALNLFDENSNERKILEWIFLKPKIENQEIADKLGLSARWVREVRQRIMEKMTRVLTPQAKH